MRRNGSVPARAMAGFWGDPSEPAPTNGSSGDALTAPSSGSSTKAPPATETIGRRAGSLSDELDFPEFVASLIHGTWDAMVDSSIRQMDSYADLVAAISKPLAQFREENVTANQARDWLVAQYPADIALSLTDGSATLLPRGGTDESGSAPSPGWLGDFGLEGQSLSPELLEEQLIPMARDRMASDRMQTLATLVMLGMNRIVVKDGSITAPCASAPRRATRHRSTMPSATTPAIPARPGSCVAAHLRRPGRKVATVGVNAQPTARSMPSCSASEDQLRGPSARPLRRRCATLLERGRQRPSPTDRRPHRP